MTAGEYGEQSSETSWSPGTSAFVVPDGFETFFRKSYPTLVRLLSVGADDVDDAVQEAFLEAHLQWDRIRRYEDPGAWVRRVAIRRLQNRLRGRIRGLRAVHRLGIDDPRPTRSEVKVDLVAAVRRLPARQRMAVALYYYGDFALSEVADAMGVTDGTVKACLHAARAQLREFMEDGNDA
jgi:RNA polymerase sigma factor (sigma-70 family)